MVETDSHKKAKNQADMKAAFTARLMIPDTSFPVVPLSIP